MDNFVVMMSFNLLMMSSVCDICVKWQCHCSISTSWCVISTTACAGTITAATAIITVGFCLTDLFSKDYRRSDWIPMVF